MARISLNEILLALVGWLLAMIFAGMIGVWGWAIWRLLTGRPILPEQPMVNVGRANWGAGTILLVLLLYVGRGFADPLGLSLGDRPAAEEARGRSAGAGRRRVRLRSPRTRERRSLPIPTRPRRRNPPPQSPARIRNHC